MTRAAIAATGRHFPSRLVPNSYFCEELGLQTSDEWIRARTGIVTRHLVDPELGETTAQMGAEAARRCLEVAGREPSDVDGILVATVTPDHMFPSTACLVQHRLGAMGAYGWDCSAACSGFLFTLAQAYSLVTSGMARRLLVIGADTMSSIIDYTDRSTCVLFGDGAGAFLVEARADDAPDVRGEILDFCMHIDGVGGQYLNMPAGGSALPASAETVAAGQHYVHQQGRAVFKHAVKRMSEVLLELLERNGLGHDDVHLFVPHQANRRIIDACIRRTGIDASRVVLTMAKWGNTTAATLPTSLDAALEEGRVERGDNIVLATFGAGFTWGAGLVRW